MPKEEIFKLLTVCAVAVLVLIWIYTHNLRDGTALLSWERNAAIGSSFIGSRLPLKQATEFTPWQGFRGKTENDRNALENDSSFQCLLEWKVVDLNVTLTEADRLEVDESVEIQQTKNPALLFENPVIPLDAGKYLLPELTYGPNNQLIGLVESVVVAIRLNRTLVLPSFHKHFQTDRYVVMLTQSPICYFYDALAVFLSTPIMRSRKR